MSQPAIADTPIQPGDIQYLAYRNSFIRGRCNSPECVLVSRPSFTYTVSAKTWNEREFLVRPLDSRLLTGEEAVHASEFFDRQRPPALPLVQPAARSSFPRPR
jgi:hypothetical protein